MAVDALDLLGALVSNGSRLPEDVKKIIGDVVDLARRQDVVEWGPASMRIRVHVDFSRPEETKQLLINAAQHIEHIKTGCKE